MSVHSARDVSGFSLLESMLVLVISAILSLSAAPVLSGWIDYFRAKAVRQQIGSLLSEARSHALKNSQVITLCRLGNNVCEDDFGMPISVFVDSNRNAERDVGENLLRVLDLNFPDTVSLSWNRSGYMRFWPSGGTGALTGSLSYCRTDRTKNDFRIVVARTGRLRIDQNETRCN